MARSSQQRAVDGSVERQDSGPHIAVAGKSQRSADSTFEQASVGMLYLDKEGVPLRVNPELCEMLGLGVRDLIGRPLKQIVHPDDLRGCVDGLRRLADGRSATFVLEQRMRRHDGLFLWTQMNLAIVPGRAGDDDQILVVVTDLSRQKRAEENARQVNERLELVIANAPIVLWAIDRHGAFTVSRGAGLTPLGLNTGDAIGRSAFEMFGQYRDVVEIMQRGLRGETVTAIARVGELTYETFVMPVRDAGGEINGVVGVSTDVTARQKFADALAHRAEFERMLATISSRFINRALEEIDAAIVEALGEIGEFCQVDRNFVFQLHEDSRTGDMTHEWFRSPSEGALPRQAIAARYQNWRIASEVPWFTEAIAKHEVVQIPRVADLPRKANTERKRLEARGVKSLLVVPMVARGKLVGFVGLENDVAERSWTDDAVVLLSIFGEILANALESKRNRLDLRRAQEELESRVEDRTAELSKANVSLRQQIAERRRIEADLRMQQDLMEQLLAAHERDRQLVAYEIHDAIVQHIAAAQMHFEAYHDRVAGQTAAENETMQRGLTLLRETIDEGRRLITGLRPPILDDQGVVAAIEYLVEEQPRAGCATVAFNHDVRFQRLAPLLEGAIYRIVQEALNNVQRHSQALRAEIRLWHQDDRIFIEVRDWGIGFNPENVTEHHFGLRGIRERAKLLHGEAEITSAPGDGATVKVQLPITPAMAFNL